MKTLSSSVSLCSITKELDDQTIAKAMKILLKRLVEPKAFLTSPALLRNYLMLKLHEREHEVFGAIWLNARHGVVRDDEMFRGTLTHTSVYPREVVKESLAVNAAAVIFYHNHPSGSVEPSEADKLLTTTLKKSLALVDVKVLDHIIAVGDTTYSFAEHGLL